MDRKLQFGQILSKKKIIQIAAKFINQAITILRVDQKEVFLPQKDFIY